MLVACHCFLCSGDLFPLEKARILQSYLPAAHYSNPDGAAIPAPPNRNSRASRRFCWVCWSGAHIKRRVLGVYTLVAHRTI